MLLPRKAAAIILEKSTQYPVVAITGPRQSGKSTAAKFLFSKKPYLSLEDLDHRRFAHEDPRRFLEQFPDGAVLDEVQHSPELFSYLQTCVDSNKKNGLFILTGSQQFSLTAKITQSLAGRVGFVQLLPFSFQELMNAKSEPSQLENMLFTGFYPPIYDRNIPPQSWYSDYVMTYVERDIRQLIHIQDLRTFHRFLQMCAVRTGQLLNLSSLAGDCGITHNTAKAWISVLEASYIVFLLSPHFKNFNKRLVKSPKLYFYDTGLACLLAGIQTAEQLLTHPMRGALFETWVATELIKQRFNLGLLSNIYFWRDSQGHEIDFLIEQGERLIPLEVKAGKTIASDYFSGIEYWQHISGQNQAGYLIYAGNQTQMHKNIQVLPWNGFDSFNPN
jgi:predicted AAA+ superfamily ATPase